jgi:predicted ribosome quality control (RQC) complex YloA/Tae2 family protein
LCVTEIDFLISIQGYITYKVSEKQPVEAQENQCQIYEEFHSFFFTQLKDALVLEKATFMNAVDEFFSLIESQRVDVSIAEQQKQALKKLENVQKDHERRLDALRRTQEKEQRQARLIEENVDLVDRIIVYMRTLMAAELSWPDVAELLERRRERGDQIAEHVINADIATNTVTILLENRREVEDEDENAEEEDPDNNDESLDDVIKVDINLNQSAFQNVTRVSCAQINFSLI